MRTDPIEYARMVEGQWVDKPEAFEDLQTREERLGAQMAETRRFFGVDIGPMLLLAILCVFAGFILGVAWAASNLPDQKIFVQSLRDSTFASQSLSPADASAQIQR